MPEAPPTPPATGDPATDPAPNTDPPADPAGTDPGDDTTGNAEAARYRRQLRETEGERDTLRTQLDAMRRAEVDRVLRGWNVTASVMEAAGTPLDELTNDDGAIDEARVKTAAEAAAEKFGMKPRQGGPRVPRSGTGGDSVSTKKGGWQDVIGGR